MDELDVLQEMKGRIILIFAVVGTLTFLSLFPTWNFSERTRLSQEKNPLWNSELKPSKTVLTKALRNEGLSFHNGRGAEADPDGICYGDFGSDEYWVVKYDPVKKEVDAYAWIIDINWIGHMQAHRRYARITSILIGALNASNEEAEQDAPSNR